MASSDSSCYISSQETQNFARLCRIVVDVFRDILWQVLIHEIQPADLPNKVQTNKKRLGKLHVKKKTWLCGISSSSPAVPVAETFDVSSLYTVIRNLCSQDPTSRTQRGKTPSPGGTTLDDDIERVIEFRNTLYRHAAQAIIDTADFNNLITDIKDVVSRFDVHFSSISQAMKCNFKSDIDTILTCSMDKTQQDVYIDKIKEIAALSDDFGDVRQQVGHVKQQVGDVKQKVGDIKQKVGDVKQQIGHVKQKVGDIKQQVGHEEQKVGNVKQKKVGDVKQQIGHVKQNVGHVKQKVGDVKQQVGHVKQKVGNVKQKVGHVKQKVGHVKQKVGNVKQKVGSVKQQIGDTKQQVDIVNQQVVDTKQQVDIVNQQVDIVNQQIGDTKQQVDIVNQQVDIVNQQIGDTKQQVDIVNQQDGDIKWKFDFVNQKGCDVKKEVGDVNQEVGDVKKEVGNVKKEVGDVTQEVGDAKQCLEILQNEEGVKEQVHSVKKNLEILQNKVDVVNKEDLQTEEFRLASDLSNQSTSLAKIPSQSSQVGEQMPSVELEASQAVEGCNNPDADKQGPVIPMEILQMDEGSIQMFKKALSDQTMKVYNIRVMIVGQFGVGKTTLCKRLLGDEVNISERKSTEGIDVHVHQCRVSMATGEWLKQDKDADQADKVQHYCKLWNDHSQGLDTGDEQAGYSKPMDQMETNLDIKDIQHMESTNLGRDQKRSSSSKESDLSYEDNNGLKASCKVMQREKRIASIIFQKKISVKCWKKV